MRESSTSSLVIIFILFFIVINLLLLDFKIFSPSEIRISEVSTHVTPVQSPTSPPNNRTTDNFSCPVNCLTLIEQATKSSTKIAENPKAENPSPAKPKEYYIPLGSGSSQKSDWEDIASTETMINFSSYGNVKEVYFIASLRNPTQNGQVEAQLYNATDKHPVWGSPVVMNGPTSQTITSGKLSVDTGNKLYRVQMISSLGALVYLDNAKIRIITD